MIDNEDFEFLKARIIKNLEINYKILIKEFSSHSNKKYYEDWFKGLKKEINQHYKYLLEGIQRTSTTIDIRKMQIRIEEDFRFEDLSHFTNSYPAVDRIEDDAFNIKSKLIEVVLQRKRETDDAKKEIPSIKTILGLKRDKSIILLNNILLLGSRTDRIRICYQLINDIEKQKQIEIDETYKTHLNQLESFLKSRTEENRIRLIVASNFGTSLTLKDIKSRFQKHFLKYTKSNLVVFPIANFIESEIVFSISDVNNPKLKFEIYPAPKSRPIDVVESLMKLKEKDDVFCTKEELKWWIYNLLGHYQGYSIHTIHSVIYRK